MDNVDDIIRDAVSLDDDTLLKLSEGEEHTFSDDYYKKLNGLLSVPVSWRKSKHLKRVVASALVAAVLICTSVAGAFWDEISAFFQKIYTQYSELTVTQKNEPMDVSNLSELQNWNTYWYPDYLPDGYSLSSAEDRSHLKTMIFSDLNKGELYFTQAPSTHYISNDVDGTPVDGIVVDNFETFAFERDIDGGTDRILIWSDADISFKLSGHFSFDELQKIAGSMFYVDDIGEE